MRVIDDPKLLQRMLMRNDVLSCFETQNLDFRLLHYEKGELISSPMIPLKSLLFVLKGSAAAYGLREDGTRFSISQGVGQMMLGALEFVRDDLPAFYTEVQEDVLCAALPIESNRAALEQDRTFTRYLFHCLTEMILAYTLIGHADQSTEEKVLIFLRDMQPDHTLSSINKSVMQFHCSRRHLQRVLKKLCDAGSLEKIGKGKYRLVSSSMQ